MPFLYASLIQAAPEQVSIQLKWQHGFQFAGYYAALEKGFYRDEGLDVTLKEIDFSKDFVEQVLAGESEYGVSDSTLLIYHLKGRPVVMLNQFFQHSPLVFLSRRNSGIISPYEMEGKTIAFNANNQGDASLNALLLNTLGDLSKIKAVSFGKPYFQKFINGETDVVSAYSTSQPYLLKKQGIEVNIINPQNYGIDFYGDNFFSTQKELDEHPGRVEKMSRASVKGWQYALDYPNEIIQLILDKYNPSLTREFLLFEARTTRQMIIPELIELGSIDPRRFQQEAEDYQRLGFADSGRIGKQFFYKLPNQYPLSVRFTEEEQKLTLTTLEQQWIKDNPVVRYGAEKDWAPYDFVNQHGKHEGLARDFLELIAPLSGLQFEPVVDDWDGLQDKVRQGQIDLLPAIYFSAARGEFLSFTVPYQSMLVYFFIRDDIDAASLEDLNGKIVAIPRGFLHLDTVRSQFPQLKILQVNNLMAAIESVIEKKADILLESHSVISYVLKKNGITTIRPFKVLPPGETRKLHMAVPKQKTVLAGLLNKALAAIPEASKNQLHYKWFGYQPEDTVQRIQLSRAEQQWLAGHPRILFTGDPNWLPYEAFDKQGKYIGIVAEHLKLIEQKLGIKVDIIPSRTWSESVAKIKRGEIDVLSETIDSDLKSHLTFTQSYLSSPVVIVMKNDEDYVDNINQIKQRNIAVINEYGYVPEIIKKHPDINFSRSNSIQEGLTAVSTGKVDALLATLAQASYHIAELGINNIRIVGKTEFNTRPAFGMSQAYAPLVPLFNRALSSISQAEKQRILGAWGKHKYKEKIDYVLLAEIAGIFLMIIIVIGYWNRKLAIEIRRRKTAEAHTRAVIDNIPLQIVVTSFEGRILSANPQTLRDYNIHREEIDQFNMLDFYHEAHDREIIKQEIAKNGKVEQKIIQFKKLDGALRSMMISIMPVVYDNRNALLTIAVDMTERLEMEAAMQMAKEHAEAANLAKSEFLANMSHEIRTPMNAILGFTELLDEQLKDPKLKSFVRTIQSASNNLLALINDILDLSKIEAGKLHIQKKPCNAHELFTELGNIFMMKMAEKDIDFILDIDPVIPQSLQLDAIRLRQVLFNLIGNAVKFTDHGFIRVRARTDNEDEIHSKLDLLIDVEDSGIGISVDQQQVIFQEFEQTSGQDVRKYGGTGLGLSISKRLVAMMGGQIMLNSQPGTGSTFSIKLTDIDIAPLAIVTEDNKFETQISFSPGVILIVDDVADNRSLLLENFAETSLKIVEAENGMKAVNLAKQGQFDLILMDIRMPVMNGYQAAQEIKLFSNVPIVALTASVMIDEFERVKSKNFDGYLRKPVLKADLIKELLRFLPYTENPVAGSNPTSIPIAEAELEWVSLALIELEKLIPQCKIVAKNNNISDIQKFSNAIMETAKQYPVSVLMEYSTQLQGCLDCFDITAIRREINHYPQLISQLEGIVTDCQGPKHQTS